jgi:AIR synthase-related protein
MTAGTPAGLVELLLTNEAFLGKRDIARLAERIDSAPLAVARWQDRSERILLGDDTAAIPDDGGFLLLAAEGIRPEFLERDPYFAGWSSIMVNVNDVAAMGGYPLAVVDVYFHAPSSAIGEVVSGMRDACAAYGVPLVGGHSTCRAGGPDALAVAILGRAEHLLTSFGARPGDLLLFGVDLRGRYRENFPFWNATEERSSESLRGDLALLGRLAQEVAVHACKDVSNAGIAGTLLMMLEASGVGASLELERLPRPPDVALQTWLTTFPSYGFLLSVPPEGACAVQSSLRSRGLACERVGALDESTELRLTSSEGSTVLWDHARRPYTGFGRRAAA